MTGAVRYPGGLTAAEFAALPSDVRNMITELDNRAAHATHASHRAHTMFFIEQSWRAAELVLKTLSVVYGGAIVAMLALVGSVIQGSRIINAISSAVEATVTFSIALLLVISAMICAYFNSTFYHASYQFSSMTYDAPYITDNKASQNQGKIGGVFRAIGIILAIASLPFAVFGTIRFVEFAQAAGSDTKHMLPAERSEPRSNVDTSSLGRLGLHDAARGQASLTRPFASPKAASTAVDGQGGPRTTDLAAPDAESAAHNVSREQAKR